MGFSEAAMATEGQSAKRFGAWHTADEHVRLWTEMVDRFRQWERKVILSGEPTSEEQAEHRDALKWLLRGSRFLLCMVSDPDFPDREAVGWLEGQVWQLNESWMMVYEPMPAEEADKFLTEVFPDGR